MHYWFALQTKPREEVAACQQVQSKGIEAYYPCVRVRTVDPRARQVKPYFPGYLFVHIDPNPECTHVLRWMPHVAGLVCCGDQPAPVPDALIAGIRRRVAEYAALNADPLRGLKAGDPVRIQDGPFDGYAAVLDARLSGNDRVRVLLDLINGNRVALDLPAARLERAAAGKPAYPGR